MPTEQVKRKVVLLGDPQVGKTSLVKRYVFNQFEESYIQTIGTQVSKKVVPLRGPTTSTEVVMNLWDVIGRRGYIGVQSDSFAGAHGVLLVSDITRTDTLTSLESYWIPLLLEITGEIPMVFLANQMDREEEKAYPLQEVEKLAARYNKGILGNLPPGCTAHYGSSAKTGANVERAFESLAWLMNSPQGPENPVREAYERVMSIALRHDRPIKTIIDATDAIILDFCVAYGDEKAAMTVLRSEFVRARLDPSQPTRATLLQALDFLAEAEGERQEPQKVQANHERRLRFIQEAEPQQFPAPRT